MPGDEPAQPVTTSTALMIVEYIKVAAALFLGDVREHGNKESNTATDQGRMESMERRSEDGVAGTCGDRGHTGS